MKEHTESKSELWMQIEEMSKADPIVHMAFELLKQGMLEDKENLLMFIVVRCKEYTTTVEMQNDRLRTDFYAKKSQLNKETTNV